MSCGARLSSILGNMILDGLQSYLYDHLYPSGGVDYRNGNLHRFADDMAITAYGYEQAEKIMAITSEFLAQRGLRMHPDKSCIANVNAGFDYIGRNYKRVDGVLTVTPAGSSIRKMEHELEKLIMNFTGTQRALIEKINQKLKGWGTYHRVEDAYMEFRHIDAVVEGLLVKKMCAKYPSWHRQTVLNKFWAKDGMTYVFILPTDPSVRVVQLAQLPIVRHKPCGVKFNPYLDQDYHVYLKHRRDAQKSNGAYRAVWTRQSGRCAYCNQRMLADQEIELVEKNIGQGWKIKNLIYIHRRCSYQVCFSSNGAEGEPIDLFSMLDGIMEEVPAEESPYVELTEFFRTNKNSVIHLRFQEIERILGDRLPWEAYCFEAFWYDDTPELSSSLWKKEDYPFHTIRFTAPEYNIIHSWTRQGYKIKALHLETNQVTFRRENKNMSGITLPKTLTDQRLPDDVAYNFQKLVKQFIKDNGL